MNPLLISGIIFALSYLVVTRRPITEAFEYAIWAIGLGFLAMFITPSGATIFSDFRTLAIIFIGINAISQARFKNTIRQDLLISGVGLALTYAIDRGLINLGI